MRIGMNKDAVVSWEKNLIKRFSVLTNVFPIIRDRSCIDGLEFEELHSKGHTIILVTHETYTAGYAERIIKLLDGKIVSDGKITGTIEHKHFKK